jgi:hypothetical protein
MPPHPRTGRGSIAGPGADKGSGAPIRQPAGLGLRYPRRGQVEDQAQTSWRTRAAAIGGGSAAFLFFGHTGIVLDGPFDLAVGQVVKPLEEKGS